MNLPQPTIMSKRLLCYVLLPALLVLSACDLLGIPDPAKDAAKKEADGRATGSACRHAGRAIEDCYTLNADASRAAIYAGWKEMNDYMRENKIDEVVPTIPSVPPATKPEAEASAPASSAEKAPDEKKKEQ
jgi:hypothetical protein